MQNEAAVTDFPSALRGMTSKVFCGSEKFREQQWRANRVGAHPDILDFERLFIRRMRKHDVPMFAHCVMRTEAEQLIVVQQGRSLADAGKSPHQHGFAVDIVHGLRAWDLERHQWVLLGHIGKEVANAAGIDVEWGGDWDFYDPAHWELRDWRKLPPVR